MFVIKVESLGGTWEYVELDDITQISRYLVKHPEKKLRLTAKVGDYKEEIERIKESIYEKRNNSRV